MQPYIPIVIPPGVIRGATSRATAGRWHDTSLVRWRAGVLQPIGGWERIDVPLLESTARTIYGWVANNGSRQIGIGCDAGFYSLWETRLLDITPENFIPDETTKAIGGYGVGLYGMDDYGTGRAEGEPDDFLLTNVISMDNFGERLMACTSTDGRLYVYDPSIGPDQRLKEVIAPKDKAPVPISNRAMLVSPERFVILIGADGNDRRVAWSSREDYLDWDFASVTNTAGYLDLDAASPLIAIKSVKNATLIFSKSEVYMLKYIGLPSVHGVEKIQENTSLMSPYAIAAFDGKAMWWNRTGFSIYDAGYIKPVPCDVMDFLIKDVDPAWASLRTHAVVNNVFSEITWYYCSKDAAATGTGGGAGSDGDSDIDPGPIDPPVLELQSVSTLAADEPVEEEIIPRVRQVGYFLAENGFCNLPKPMKMGSYMLAFMTKNRETFTGGSSPPSYNNPLDPYEGWTVIAKSDPHPDFATTIVMRKVDQAYRDSNGGSLNSIKAFRTTVDIKGLWAYWAVELEAREDETWEDICLEVSAQVASGGYRPTDLTIGEDFEYYLSGTVTKPYTASINFGNDGSTTAIVDANRDFINRRLLVTLGELVPFITVSGEGFAHMAARLTPYVPPVTLVTGDLSVVEPADVFGMAGTVTGEDGEGETPDPVATPGVPDSYVTFNYEEGWWSVGRLSRTAGIPVLINHDPILAGPNGELYRHEVAGKTAFSSEGAGPIFARSGAVEPVEGGGLFSMLGLYPDSESGFNSTSFTFGVRLTPETERKTYGPFVPRPDGYMDCRFTGRDVEMEMRQIKDGNWTLGKPGADIRVRGRR